jgi:thiosulfate/3-mercaptopyruvate sulfurtransferase
MTKPSPLISVDDLANRAGDLDVRVVDCRWYLGQPGRGRAAYDEGHLPDAIHLDLDADLAAATGPGRHPLPSPAEVAERLAAAGIGTDHLVVGYDDVGGWVAARLWWMLDNLGHRRVAVLDGGIGAWTAAGHELTTDEPEWTATELELASDWTGTIELEPLKRRLGSLVLLDARAAPRYRGETEPVDPVAGHIPTARNVPVARNLGEDGRFLPADELAARFRTIGADGSAGEVVTSCGSGTSACHHSLALRVAGLPDPLLYVGSYSDWSRAGEPVAVGPEPGEPPAPG